MSCTTLVGIINKMPFQGRDFPFGLPWTSLQITSYEINNLRGGYSSGCCNWNNLLDGLWWGLCWMRAHMITLTSDLNTWCAGVCCVNRTTRSGCVPEQVWTGHRPETGTVPVNFSRCERYTNEWNGTGTGTEREPEQVWTGPKARRTY